MEDLSFLSTHLARNVIRESIKCS